jgi:hypothetical protein
MILMLRSVFCGQVFTEILSLSLRFCAVIYFFGRGGKGRETEGNEHAGSSKSLALLITTSKE